MTPLDHLLVIGLYGQKNLAGVTRKNLENGVLSTTLIYTIQQTTQYFILKMYFFPVRRLYIKI